MTPEQKTKQQQREKRYREKHRERIAVGQSERNKRYYANNRDKLKHYQREHAYGLTIEQFNQMLMAQKGLCAICLEVLDRARRTHVDHDHRTGEVRAVLCGHCNRGLGAFRDNTAILRQAIAYLDIFQGDDLGAL